MSVPVHTFLPLPPRHLRSPAPPYALPRLLTTYSHLPDRSLSFDDASMAYYRQAPIGADLTYGFERKVERDESVDEHLDGLCEAIRRAEEEGGEALQRGSVVTWRGMVTRLMTAPWEDKEGWEMTALALDGSIYVELNDPPELRAKRHQDQKVYAEQSYVGYAFEAFSTTPAADADEDGPDGWSGDVNTNVQWCNVVQSAVGDIPLCLGGEVDCVRAEPGASHPGLAACIELKTNKVIENERQDAVFHKKLLKHWAQSYLLGVGHIEVGFRTPAGRLATLSAFPTHAVPAFVQSTPSAPWHPSPSLHFTHAVLALLRAHVLPTDPAPAGGLADADPLPPAVVWRFVYVPRRGCELYYDGPQTGNAGTAQRWGGVLTKDYVRWRMRRR
ncbi:decapping endonuclease targeting mRNA [Cryptotrichosporon argae]